MKRMIFVALALGAIALAQEVSHSFSQTADFASFKTYKWIPIGEARLDDLHARQPDAALQAELTTKADSDMADLYVGYQVVVKQEKELSAWGTGPRYPGGGFTTVQTSTIRIGSLDLDMYNAKKQLVWRGVATKTIDPNVKPEKRQKNIENGAAKLLKDSSPAREIGTVLPLRNS